MLHSTLPDEQSSLTDCRMLLDDAVVHGVCQAMRRRDIQQAALAQRQWEGEPTLGLPSPPLPISEAFAIFRSTTAPQRRRVQRNFEALLDCFAQASAAVSELIILEQAALRDALLAHQQVLLLLSRSVTALSPPSLSFSARLVMTPALVAMTSVDWPVLPVRLAAAFSAVQAEEEQVRVALARSISVELFGQVWLKFHLSSILKLSQQTVDSFDAKMKMLEGTD